MTLQLKGSQARAEPCLLIELLRTNDLVLLSLIDTLLTEHAIGHFVADQHMSALEGSTGFLQRRVLVAADQASRARRILADAGLSFELRTR